MTSLALTALLSLSALDPAMNGAIADTSAPLAAAWDNGLAQGGWSYLYGGTTEGTSISSGNRHVLAYRGDDREYSGWTAHLPRNADLAAVRRTGGLQVRFRGALGGEKVVLGLMDDESDGPGKKSQTRVALADFAKTTTQWQTVTIPLSAFDDQGYWWDDARHVEIAATMDWSRIAEIRISSERGANSKLAGPDHRFEVQFDQVRLVAVGPVVWDAQAHWAAFHSDAAPKVLWAWDSATRKPWTPGCDPSSVMTTRLDSADGVRFQRLDYQITKWANAGGNPEATDWSRHAGIALRLRSHRKHAVVQFALTDSTGENWIASATLAPGWNEIVVPFSEFGRNPWYQPDDAGSDRRLDLGSVRWFQAQPQENGLPGTIEIARIWLTNAMPNAPSTAARARILSSRAGWRPASVKRFLVADAMATDFAVLDASGKAVLVAPLTKLGRSSLSGQDLSIGDLSRLSVPGTYRLAVDTMRSEPFRIGEDVLAAPVRDALRAFYFLRASVDLPAKFAGSWSRSGGHPDTALGWIEAGEGRKGTWSATGGWYDAGDYGKYVVNGGISVSTLLLMHELVPQAIPDGRLGIPESGNGVSDLLDEVRWELEWMALMQDRDGGVFFKIAGKSWPGMIMPDKDEMARFVIGKSTASSLNLAAVMAQASRLWKSVDPKFSKSLLSRSERAWTWALAHPKISQPSENGGSGGYGDSEFDDEFFWAATELWLATGKAPYRVEIARRLETLPLLESADWSRTQNLGYYSLALKGGKDPLVVAARHRLDSVATLLRESQEREPLRIPVEGFRWGSNGDLANRGVLLAVHHAISSDAADIPAIGEMVDYLYGRNAVGVSFITGVGPDAMRRPHLRFSAADTVELPPPGFLSGGPNAGRQDDVSRNPGGVRYLSKEPALSWIDDERSYASNEVAINWNAPLALILAYLEAHTK